MNNKPPDNVVIRDDLDASTDDDQKANLRSGLELNLLGCFGDHTPRPPPPSPREAAETEPRLRAAVGPGKSNSNGSSDDNGSNERTFRCKHCFKNFFSQQALGGHQNAHKQERAQMKKEKQGIMESSAGEVDFFNGHNNNNNIKGLISYNYHRNHPHHYQFLPTSSSFDKALGVQAHSMIHKPSSSRGVAPAAAWSRAGLVHGYLGWPATAVRAPHQYLPDGLGFQPAVAMINDVSFNSANTSIGGSRVFHSQSPGFHSMTNVAFSNNNQDPHSEAMGLDLSLRL